MEVKARHNELYGFPEESIDNRKMKSLMRAAEEFQELFPEWTRIQYDVLSILITEQGNSITLIEDIYL
jgi:putative endonuclease